MLGMSGYTSVFSEKDGVLKSHLNLLCIDERITKKNFRNGEYNTLFQTMAVFVSGIVMYI